MLATFDPGLAPGASDVGVALDGRTSALRGRSWYTADQTQITAAWSHGTLGDPDGPEVASEPSPGGPASTLGAGRCRRPHDATFDLRVDR